MKRELHGLTMLAALGLSALGVWFWNYYTYWSCRQTGSAGGAIQESCVGRLAHPHREIGAVLFLAGAAFFVGMLVASRLRRS